MISTTSNHCVGQSSSTTKQILRSGSVNSDEKPGRLFFLVGLPASGKSTYANDFAQHAPLEHYKTTKWGRVKLEGPHDADETIVARPRTIVAGDDFRWSVTGHEFLPHAEATVFAMMDVAILALLRRGFDVLVDETSTSRSTILRYLRLDTRAEPIFIDTPTEECKRRAKAKGRDYLLPVIDRLAPRLERLKANWPAIRDELLAEVEHRLTQEMTVK